MIDIKQLLVDILQHEQETNSLSIELIKQLSTRLKSFSAAKDPIFDQVRTLIHRYTSHIDTNILECKVWHILNMVRDVPICNMCSSPVKWDKGLHRYRVYCSQKCKGSDPVYKQTLQQTNIERYGTTSPTQNSSVKAKISKTWADKTSSQISSIVETRTQTLHDKYGVTHPLDVPGAKSKREATCVNKWGTLHSSQSDEHKQNVQQTWKDKTTAERECTLRKYQSTCVENYGVCNPSQSEDIKNKKIQTIMKNFNVDNPNYIGKDMESFDKLKDPNWLLEEHYNKQTTLRGISQLLQISGNTVGRYLRSHGLETQYFSRSTGEKQLSQFLTDNQIVHDTNVRSIISPFELDIYIPACNLAIEYCGLYWHSEQQGKDRHYHSKKHKACKDKGIQLLTIFEDEWLERREQVKRKLLHLIGITKGDGIYARKTTVCVLNTKQKNQFFEANHIQGSGPGSITYGLVHNEIIVSAMSFIKQPEGVYALNRYATSTHVVGGFSKLLNYFKHNNEWVTLISFADLRWSDGNLYIQTGWTLDSILPPDYYYSPDGIHRIHKFNYRRKNLPKLLKHFDPTLSEMVNCNNNGVLRIWDCGKLRFTIENPVS